VGSAVSWYLPDRQGTIRNMTDAAGVLSDTITYDAFGKVTNETSTANGDRYKYTGRELDSESQLLFRPTPIPGAAAAELRAQSAVVSTAAELRP
jgi:hypothetical protein